MIDSRVSILVVNIFCKVINEITWKEVDNYTPTTIVRLSGLSLACPLNRRYLLPVDESAIINIKIT